MNVGNRKTQDIAATVRGRLEEAGVRCTRPRMLLAQILLEKDQHLSADQVLALAKARGGAVSKATVYNTLGLFARLGLVREVIVDPQRIFYDSNTRDHHHIYHEDDGSLADVGEIRIEGLPKLPRDTTVQGVEVIIRVRREARK